MAQLPQDVRSALRFFAFSLANGTLDQELLAGVDYRPRLMGFESGLERAFVIFTNVLDLDELGRVTNFDQAKRRAAQWVRSCSDASYQVEPPFADWETELV